MHGTGAAYVTLLVSLSRQARAGVCLNICRGGLRVIDGSDTRGESAPRAGAVCKRGERTHEPSLTREASLTRELGLSVNAVIDECLQQNLNQGPIHIKHEQFRLV